MRTFLLDTNVLIALIDPTHIDHDAVHLWFKREGRSSWATCPMTENGVLRIVGNPKYPNSPGSPVLAADILERLCNLPGHVFWNDDISLLDGRYVNASEILTPNQVTDTYLLALAVSHHGTLATLDRRLSAKAVNNGKANLHLIPT
ncbi:TA system VapC family ribonuclease toxin [Labrys neptuniae]